MLPDYLTRSREALETQSRQGYQSAYLGSGTLLCRVLGRYLVRADAADVDITPHLCLDGFWESWVTLAMARCLKPGMRCVDVGANHGYYTLLMADAVGEDGRVLALEPNPRLAGLVRLNAHANGVGERVEVLERAAAEHSGRPVELVMAPSHAGTASICRARAPGERSIRVSTITLDEALSAWPRVDLLKVDAEGAEPRIWDGLGETLRENPQLIVFLELTPSSYADADGFLRRIEGCGFPLRYVDVDGAPRPATREELLAPGGERWRMLCLSRP